MRSIGRALLRHLTLNGSACLALLAVVLVVLAPRSGAQWTSTPTPPSLVGEHLLMFPGQMMPAGTLTGVCEGCTEEEPLIQVFGTALGGGWAVPADDGYIVYFTSGEKASISRNVPGNRLEVELSLAGTHGFLIPASANFFPVSPAGPDGQSAMMGVATLPQDPQGPLGPGGVEIIITWPGWLAPWIHDIDIIQFVTVTAEVIRTDGAGGTTSEPLPPDKKINISGNGGGNATQEQRDAGAGDVVIDGSRTYVDSMTPGVPEYREGGGSGMDDTENGYHSLDDNPSPPPGAVNDLINGLPNQATILGVRVTMDFDVYVLVDGAVFYRFSWSRTFFLPVGGGPPTVTGLPPIGGPCGQLDPSDMAAFLEFAGGGFNGAPN